jgi:parallel beta-helix repeat protein
VEDNVAGLEIENSIDAFVHNNYATTNTGGLLVFKLPGLPLQESRDHVVSHNVSDANNTDNFASGGAVQAIPRGTGFLILSNDQSVFEYNVARGNDTFGFLFLDQEAANLFGAGFDPTSPDQKAQSNLVTNNEFTNNGSNPDAPLGGNIGFLIGELGDPADHGNCFVDNVTGPLPDVIQVEPQCN